MNRLSAVKGEYLKAFKTYGTSGNVKIVYANKGDRLLVVNEGSVFMTLKNLSTKRVFWIPANMASFYFEKE